MRLPSVGCESSRKDDRSMPSTRSHRVDWESNYFEIRWETASNSIRVAAVRALIAR
jgi:hypothetical protein